MQIAGIVAVITDSTKATPTGNKRTITLKIEDAAATLDDGLIGQQVVIEMVPQQAKLPMGGD